MCQYGYHLIVTIYEAGLQVSLETKTWRWYQTHPKPHSSLVLRLVLPAAPRLLQQEPRTILSPWDLLWAGPLLSRRLDGGCSLRVTRRRTASRKGRPGEPPEWLSHRKHLLRDKGGGVCFGNRFGPTPGRRVTQGRRFRLLLACHRDPLRWLAFYQPTESYRLLRS